jgi:F-type H+-transporting ATPase subunit b
VLIDWFTVAAQMVNFLILVALLKYFLYGRITKAMDEREERIASRLHEAEQWQQEAAAETAAYRQQRQELEAKRAALLAQARDSAATQRQELLAAARQEVESMRARWQKAMHDEQETFLHDLRQRASQQLLAVARRALTDLAHADLEQQMVGTFVDKLRTLDDNAWEALAASQHDADQPLVVYSAFVVPPVTRQQLQHLLQERLGAAVRVRFETLSEVLCGIELRTNGGKIAWTLEHYLDTLEESLATAFAEIRAPTDADLPEAATATHYGRKENGHDANA